MCLAKPVKVLNLRGDWAEVDDDGKVRRAWCALVTGKGLRAGDYLLVHGDLAIHKVPEDEALRIIEMVDKHYSLKNPDKLSAHVPHNTRENNQGV